MKYVYVLTSERQTADFENYGLCVHGIFTSREEAVTELKKGFYNVLDDYKKEYCEDAYEAKINDITGEASIYLKDHTLDDIFFDVRVYPLDKIKWKITKN